MPPLDHFPSSVLRLLEFLADKPNVPHDDIPSELLNAPRIALRGGLVETQTAGICGQALKHDAYRGLLGRAYWLSPLGKDVLAEHRERQADAARNKPTAEVAGATEGKGDRAATQQPAPATPRPEISHADDFRSVRWYGTEYIFTPTQAACVRVLWEAWERGSPVVGQASILEAADSTGSRLRDVFEKGMHPAWGTMIVPARKGAFRFAEPA